MNGPVQNPVPAPDRTGRLDLLATDGLGRLADNLGARFGLPLRPFLQPVIDRFVAEKVTSERLPVTPEEIAERMGILEPRGKRRRRV